MNNQPNIATHPHRPEVLVPRLVKFMKTHSRISWINLEIKGRCLDSLLLLAGQFGEAVGESICNTEVQGYILSIFDSALEG